VEGTSIWGELIHDSQRLEIKGLKFFRFGDHRLWLSVGV
jgi:hypothetical protein